MIHWASSLLEDQHVTTDFDCGNPALNHWLQSQALRAQNADTARTYAWTAPGDFHVKAYYSIAPTQVLKSEVTGGIAGGYSVIPAYLLAKLALDQSLRGRGYGGELLYDALEVIIRGARATGGRLIVVDAIDDDATKFYQHYDFRPVKDNPNRLVMKVATAKAALHL